MNTLHRWSLGKDERQKYIDILTEDLAPLRVKLGITQGELASLIGVARQTYSAYESGRKPITWSAYLSLVFFFDSNQATHQMIRTIGAFPDELVERFNEGNSFTVANGILNDDNRFPGVRQMLGELDDKGLHSLHSLLLVEYARCTDADINVTRHKGK